MRWSRRPERDLSRQLLTRLIGQETEYAVIAFGAREQPWTELPAARDVYAQIAAAIRGDQPVVTGLHDDDQLFLASGCAVTFESHPSLHSMPGGLVEVATAEVRSPADLLACQRSADAMLSEAVAQTEFGVELRVLKNSSDAYGHVYGCQENYEAVVARGGWLVAYRVLILAAAMLHLIGLVAALPAIAAMILYLIVRRLIFRNVAGPGDDPADQFNSLPAWFSATVVGCIRVSQTPTVMLLRLIGRRIAFRPQRRYLTAMLISRLALCGSGDLDHDGRYRLSAKAMATDRIADMGGFRGERPIYVYGHWFEQLCSKSLLSVAAVKDLLKRKQRFQIGLSESNLSDLAEYVKFGSVSLLLDMIEQGCGKQLPTIRRPLTQLHRIASDWNLVTRVPTNRGEMSAIELQLAYWKAAEQFVEATPYRERGEAALLLDRWREMIELASAYRRDAAEIRPALGKLDWLSKRWLIDELGADAAWAERKKVDLRYHELSVDGYHRRLVEHDPTLQLVDEGLISRRRRNPPAKSPAARRAWLIREFAGSSEDVRSDWAYALVGSGRNRRRVDFSEPPV